MLSKGNIKEAQMSLEKLRNTQDVRSEIEEIQNKEKSNDNEANVSNWQLLMSENLRLCLFSFVYIYHSSSLGYLGYFAIQLTSS